MIYKDDLTILHDDDGTFTELSRELNDYQRDEADITMLAGTGTIYIGLYKPFNALYIEVIDVNAAPIGDMVLTYYDGTDFSNELPLNVDETNTLRRSGFVRWIKPVPWQKTEVNGDELYWVSAKFTEDTSAMKIRAINIVFCNDNELEKELSTINKYKDPNGANKSFVSTHATVRDDIVQSLRVRGKVKESGNEAVNITKWDLLDIDEVWVAAKYFALEKIFFQASDEVGDKWETRQKQASTQGNAAFDLIYLSLDTNDDGKDEGEKLRRQHIDVQRI